MELDGKSINKDPRKQPEAYQYSEDDEKNHDIPLSMFTRYYRKRDADIRLNLSLNGVGGQIIKRSG